MIGLRAIRGGVLEICALSSSLRQLLARVGTRLAAWVSSNFATATYSETTNSLSVAYDGNRLILNDLELRQQFPNAADYPAAPPASPTKPFSVDHMLGPSFVSGGQQVFEFVRKVYLPTPAECILSKITLKSGAFGKASQLGSKKDCGP